MKIPFVSFRPMERELDAQLREAFNRVFDASWYIDGKEDAAFEQAFAEYCGQDYWVGCGNGLDALMLPLKALGIEGRCTVIIGDDDINAYLSFRNIKSVNVMPVAFMNTYDFLDNKNLVVASEALARIEEVLA